MKSTKRARSVSPAEVGVVQTAVAHLSPGCRVELKKGAIVVSEASRGRGGFEPVLRFVLGTDDDARHFYAERMLFRGEPRWFPLFSMGPLEEVVGVVRHVGKDSFYELM